MYIVWRRRRVIGDAAIIKLALRYADKKDTTRRSLNGNEVASFKRRLCQSLNVLLRNTKWPKPVSFVSTSDVELRR
jgi:hypothetical protein